MAVAALVVSAVAIPLLTLLFQERDTEQRSRFEYVAVLAARDEMFESRMALAAGATPESLAHDWRPLTGNPLDRLAGAAPGVVVDATYHPEQERIATHLAVDPDPGTGSRIRLATVTVRWLDPAAAAGPTPGKERPTSIQLVFGMLLPPGGP